MAASVAAWNGEIATHSATGHDLALDDGGWIVAGVRQWRAHADRPGPRTLAE